MSPTATTTAIAMGDHGDGGGGEQGRVRHAAQPTAGAAVGGRAGAGPQHEAPFTAAAEPLSDAGCPAVGSRVTGTVIAVTLAVG